MRTVGAFEAKTYLSQLLLEVEKGEKIAITKYGRPVAIIEPIQQENKVLQTIAEIRRNRKGITLGEKLTIRQMIEEGRR